MSLLIANANDDPYDRIKSARLAADRAFIDGDLSTSAAWHAQATHEQNQLLILQRFNRDQAWLDKLDELTGNHPMFDRVADDVDAVDRFDQRDYSDQTGSW